MTGTCSLSLAAVDILSQTLDVNVRLFPFEIPSVGLFQEDRVRIAKAVFTDLAQRGLVRQGELDPDLERALRTVADHRVAVAAMGTLDADRQLFARASATAETGVLAVQEGQQLRLELIRPTALAASMVGLLPALEAGPGQSVNLTKPAPVGRRDGGDYFASVHGPRYASDGAVRIAESYLSRPRTGAGFFTVSGRDRAGREIRGGDIGWFDTDAGRYLSLTQPTTDDGQIHGTFSPADAPRLIQQLGQLIAAVSPRD